MFEDNFLGVRGHVEAVVVAASADADAAAAAGVARPGPDAHGALGADGNPAKAPVKFLIGKFGQCPLQRRYAISTRISYVEHTNASTALIFFFTLPRSSNL